MKWTEEKKEYLRQEYRNGNIQQVADHFGMSRQSLVAAAKRYGIKCGRYFSKEEKKYMDKYIGIMSYSEIGSRLGRSADAIKKYACKNGYSTSTHYNRICLAELCRLVGRDKETIKRVWTKYGLMIHKVGSRSMITVENLFEFMQNNPDRWDATQCEKWYFEQYDWFQEKRKQDFEKMVQNRWGRVG